MPVSVSVMMTGKVMAVSVMMTWKVMLVTCACADVDECASWGNSCPQECQNVKGSFKCQCHKGFFDTDNKGLECKAASEFSSCNQLHFFCFAFLDLKKNEQYFFYIINISKYTRG